jgi:hypothetical protein
VCNLKQVLDSNHTALIRVGKAVDKENWRKQVGK